MTDADDTSRGRVDDPKGRSGGDAGDVAPGQRDEANADAPQDSRDAKRMEEVDRVIQALWHRPKGDASEGRREEHHGEADSLLDGRNLPGGGRILPRSVDEGAPSLRPFEDLRQGQQRREVSLGGDASASSRDRAPENSSLHELSRVPDRGTRSGLGRDEWGASGVDESRAHRVPSGCEREDISSLGIKAIRSRHKVALKRRRILSARLLTYCATENWLGAQSTISDIQAVDASVEVLTSVEVLNWLLSLAEGEGV